MNVKTNEVNLKDLRELGKLGGATARLIDGQEMILEENYGLIRRTGIVLGKVKPVETIERYVSIYSSIRTIKWNNLIIARRVVRGGKSILELTGNGYKRKN